MRFQATVNDWENIPGATIAVINGHAAGGGCEMTLACDWRLMARGRPKIGLPEGPKGLLPAGGGTQRMVRLLGRARALDMCIRGRLVDADEAERIGLVHEAVDPDELDARSEALAEELLALPQLTLRDSPQRSRPESLPQHVVSRAQKAPFDSEQPQTFAVLHVELPVQVPQLTVRCRPQRSIAVRLPQFAESRVHSAVGDSGVQPQVLPLHVWLLEQPPQLTLR